MTPASIRNNNPGACEPGYATRKFGSTSYETLRWKGTDGKPRTNRIATFATPQHGAAAQMHLLATGKHYRNKPIREAIATWCGGYSVGTYERVLAKRSGVTPDTVLTSELLADPAFAIPLCRAMARQEAGREFPMDDAGWQQAHAMAFGDGLAPQPTETNDVPFPKPEAKARETVATATKVGTAVTAAGGAATVVTSSDAITKATETITTAKGLGEAVDGAARFALASPVMVLIAVLCGAAVLLWPKIREKIG